MKERTRCQADQDAADGARYCPVYRVKDTRYLMLVRRIHLGIFGDENSNRCDEEEERGVERCMEPNGDQYMQFLVCEPSNWGTYDM